MTPGPRLTLIVARARNGVIGRGGTLPWRLPEDLAHFKRTTMGHPIVMGRRTWDSIGRALPGRRSIVVSGTATSGTPGAEIVPSLAAALARVRDVPEVFVIGGAELFKVAAPLAQRMIVTEIDADFEGDTFFPQPDPGEWTVVAREPHAPTADRPFAIEFVTYDRRPAS
ncbi:MAG TPA: dihydrofolate reductase [Burkholderiaceae bacterium]|nr:dihydrofolate reductase [Burkholderiaceae bacterium]